MRDAQWDQIRQSLGAIHQKIELLQQQIQATREELGRQGDVQRGLAEQRTEFARQQEELRDQVRRMEEQLKALRERAGTEAVTYGQTIEQLRSELQRMGQTLGRVEKERLDAETGLKTEVQRLRQRVYELRNDLIKMQGAVDMLLVGVRAKHRRQRRIRVGLVTTDPAAPDHRNESHTQGLPGNETRGGPFFRQGWLIAEV